MNTTTSTPSRHRARWAAIGAAVAVSLGAGGIGLVNATSPAGASTLVPIDPCRIADTRSTQQIGLKTSPFGPNETHVVHTRGAETGQCSPLPNDITAVALNVTAVEATTLTHFTFWASGPLPNSSSLNPAAGEPPTPNAVTTEVAADGSFRVFNFAGSVDLIIDVVGYYSDHHHDDRYYTKAEADARWPIAQGHLGITSAASSDVNVTGTPGLNVTWNVAGDYFDVSLDGVSLTETTHVVHVTPERINFGDATADRIATTFFTGGNVQVMVWDEDALDAVPNDVHITIWAL